jgi:DNA-directed RNA polymerase specialized sigma24 family protein
MAWVEGHTCTELAAEMGVPLGTVKSWLRRSSALAQASLAD